MDCRTSLLDALQEVGEPAAFYKGQDIIMANELFAGIFKRTVDECVDLPINDICHESSIDMIQDFIKRRHIGDPNLPTTYSAKFVTVENDELNLTLTVIVTNNTGGAILVIVKKND